MVTTFRPSTAQGTMCVVSVVFVKLKHIHKYLQQVVLEHFGTCGHSRGRTRTYINLGKQGIKCDSREFKEHLCKDRMPAKDRANRNELQGLCDLSSTLQMLGKLPLLYLTSAYLAIVHVHESL